MTRRLLIWGAISAGIGVAAGAFGAHALRGLVTPERLLTFETGVRYQMYHAFAMLACAWQSTRDARALPYHAGLCFLVGTVLFSGSLYALTLSGVGPFGAIAPVGGAAFLAGWVLLARSATTHRG